MSGAKTSGFTIIEVMLFLAISGLLAVGILAAASTAINVQRYKDATNSLLSYFQGEYDKVANVQDNRATGGVNTSSVSCGSGGFKTLPAGQADTVGASSCFIIGRLLTVSNNGSSVQAQSVFATADGTGSDDIQALKASNLFTDAANSGEVPDVYAPEWSTRLVTATDRTKPLDGWRLLIVRSPTTGTIHTFTTMDSSLSLSGMVGGNAATRYDAVVCLDPVGLVSYQPSGVKILKDAASVSAIKSTNPGDCQ